MNDQRTFAAALLDPEAPCPAGLTAWNGSDSGQRGAVITLSPDGVRLLTGLLAGLPLGEAAKQALLAEPDFDLAAMLALLLRYGALSSLTLPVEHLP